MKKDVDTEAKIADFEFALRRRQSEYDALVDRLQKTEQHLQSVLAERDRAITDAAVLRMDVTGLQNDNIRLHAKNGDLERQLDAQLPDHCVRDLHRLFTK